MARQNVKFLSAVACILAIGILVSGCGRRGSLELPPSSAVETTDEQGNKVTRRAPKPDKPFILDGLI
jgi:predicted small lipoprotein YifL